MNGWCVGVYPTGKLQALPEDVYANGHLVSPLGAVFVDGPFEAYGGAEQKFKELGEHRGGSNYYLKECADD